MISSGAELGPSIHASMDICSDIEQLQNLESYKRWTLNKTLKNVLTKL